MNWEDFRRNDAKGTIDLQKAMQWWEATHGHTAVPRVAMIPALAHLRTIESMQPVTSRQVAAAALSAAIALGKLVNIVDAARMGF